jgi:hypothetical protein
MPRIKTKNSTTSTSTPTSGSLLQGELAVNITDKRLFVGNASGNPVEITNQGVTAVYGSTSRIYVTQATGSTTIGLDPDIYVSGSMHVSGVLTDTTSALNIFASEDPTTSWSHWINAKTYNGLYSEVAGTDGGDLVFRTDSNTIRIEPTGSLAVTLDTLAASTGYLYPTPNDVRIGNSNTTTTFPGNVTITKALTVDHITGDMDGAVLKACKNTDSVTLRKGDPVFISGNVGASDVIEIQLARADTTAKMPAVGLCAQSLAVNATGYIVIVGVLSDTDTSAFTVGNSVYVNSTGWVTNVRPTGASILVQNIGRVGRVNSNNGQIIVLGPGRTNDVPNNILASGTLTLGTPDIITPLAGTASVFDTNIVTANAFTSASNVNIATGNIFDPQQKIIKIGTTAGGDGTVTISLGSSSAGTTTINSPSTVLGGDIAVNGGDITTSNSSATIFNTTAARVNIGGGASGVQIGHPTGTVVMGNIAANSGTISTTATSANIFNTTAARVNIGGGASGVQIGHPTGVVTVGDIAVNDGTITTTAASVTVFNTTATTLSMGGAATTMTIGGATSASTLNIGTGANGAGVTKTINIGTGASVGSATTNITIGPSTASTGTITINGRTNVIGSTATGITIGGLTLDTTVGSSTGFIDIGTNSIVGGHKIINIGTNGSFGNSQITIGNTLGGLVLKGSSASGVILDSGPLRAIGQSILTSSDVRATGAAIGWSSVQSTGHMLAASGYRITSNAINAQTATGYTLQASDNGRVITFNSAASHTLRIPTGLDVGFNATIIQLGTGQVTCTGLSGATLNCYASGNKISGQFGAASIICYTTDTYNLAGTLTV